MRIKQDDVYSNYSGWHLVIPSEMVVELEPQGDCNGCCEVWDGREFVGKHKPRLFLGFISLSFTSSLLKHFAIKRVWSGLFSALSLHPELH